MDPLVSIERNEKREFNKNKKEGKKNRKTVRDNDSEVSESDDAEKGDYVERQIFHPKQVCFQQKFISLIIF